MLRTQRWNAIVAEILSTGSASIRDLAQRLNVSEITIRRDIRELDRAGRLKRVRGGAQLERPGEPEPPAVQRQLCQTAEKQSIGKAAMELIADDDVIAMQAGSTTLELARAISKRSWTGLRVVTNSFMIAEVLIRVPGVVLMFMGGIIDTDELATFSVSMDHAFMDININRLFIGCRGIDPVNGLSLDSSSAMEINTVRALAAHSGSVVVLADHTKFGNRCLLQVLPVQALEAIITDEFYDELTFDAFRKQGVRVLVGYVGNDQGK